MSLIRMIIPDFFCHKLFEELASFLTEALSGCTDNCERVTITCLWGHLFSIFDDPYSEMQYHRGLDVIDGKGSPAYQAAIAVMMAIRYSRGDRVADLVHMESPLFPGVAVHTLMHSENRFARLICLAALDGKKLSKFYKGIKRAEIAEAKEWLATMPGRKETNNAGK